MALPDLPPEFRWIDQQPHKIVFQHIESGKRYGVRTFSPDGLGEGVKQEIAYGVAKIAREIERDREWCANNA